MHPNSRLGALYQIVARKPAELAEKIKEQGYVYKGHPGSITKCLERIEVKLGIPKFPLRKLRHYFASQMSSLGVPEADILRMGGWETDYVMKSVYRHSMMDKEEQAKRAAAECPLFLTDSMTRFMTRFFINTHKYIISLCYKTTRKNSRKPLILIENLGFAAIIRQSGWQDSNTFSRLFQAFLRSFIPLEVQSENRFADFTLTKSVAVASPQKGRSATERFC